MSQLYLQFVCFIGGRRSLEDGWNNTGAVEIQLCIYIYICIYKGIGHHCSSSVAGTVGVCTVL